MIIYKLVTACQHSFQHFPKEIKITLVKIKTHFSWKKEEKGTFTVSNSIEDIKALNVNTDESKTAKITRGDLEKSCKLYEEKLVILAQKLSSAVPINNDDYNPQTEYYPLIGEDGVITKYIPTTEL
ncbi:hypothetical protein [Rickettsia oklahomensis]|uniref:Uncharacterized protein n=1 Tax=Rickettsia oklahomensis TaxID=3141789 RepID=A0AAU7BZA3_9RICK